MNHSHSSSSCLQHGEALEQCNDTVSTPISLDGRATPGESYCVPARRGRAVTLRAGEVIRIVNTHGTQVCDFWAFNLEDLTEHFSIEHTRGGIGRINVKAGDTLLSNRRRPLLEFVADTSPGVHDTLIAACDLERYRGLGHHGGHDTCVDNMRMALRAIGLEKDAVPQPLNLWMNIPILDGKLRFEPTVSKPGDYVDFKAIVDCVVVLSACPMDLNEINGRKPVDLAFEVGTAQDLSSCARAL